MKEIKKSLAIIEVCIAIIIILNIIILKVMPEFIHICDDCDKFFIGTGYVSSRVNRLDDTICKECAKKQYYFVPEKILKEFKRKPFDR